MSNYNCYKIKNTNIKLQNLLDKLFVISKILKEDNITISGSVFYAINYNINNLFNSLKESSVDLLSTTTISSITE